MVDGYRSARSGEPERLFVLLLNASATRGPCLAAALNECEGIRCHAQDEPSNAEDAEEAPDVVLVDLPPDKMAHTELLLRKAIALYPNAAMMLLSDAVSPEAKQLMKRLPLSGCIMSSESVETMALCLKLAHEGIAVLPRVLLDQMRRARTPTPVPARARGSGPRRPGRFTGRQAEVVHLLMEGLSNKAIAHRLGITESTVKNHIRAIMARMGVISRIQVVLTLLEGR